MAWESLALLTKQVRIILPEVLIRNLCQVDPMASTLMEPAMLSSLQYVQNPIARGAVMLTPMSAPVPRHSSCYGASMVSNCERTCQQEQEQQERRALRIRTLGSPEQRTVRPAEVSPVMSFTDLPNTDDDGEGEPDTELASLHEIGRRSVDCSHRARFEGTLDYAGHQAALTMNSNVVTDDEDTVDIEEYFVHEEVDDYRMEQGGEVSGDGNSDFTPERRTTSKNIRGLRARSAASRSSARYQPYDAAIATKCPSKSPIIPASDLSPSSSTGQASRVKKNARTLPIPIPVPNLTKKSRGRRVPTVQIINHSVRGHRDAALNARIYFCDVSGCGKCFARGEHLKRHIRSIHTHEKRTLVIFYREALAYWYCSA